MNKGKKLYEGKAKILYEGPEKGTAIQHFKDDATAFNNKKKAIFLGEHGCLAMHTFIQFGKNFQIIISGSYFYQILKGQWVLDSIFPGLQDSHLTFANP